MVTESPAVQDYLKTIFQLGGGEREVSTSRLAERLDVTPASVSAMLRRLHDQGLVRHERYRGVRLTVDGARQAIEMIRHHRLLELYLVQVVGMPWDAVHDEAERLEHAISEDLEFRLDDLLGHPTTDPHGDPIPTPDLVLEEVVYPTLADRATGDVVVVRRVSDRSPELLRHLDELGLRPGVRVRVLEVVPFGGGVRVRVGEREHLVGSEAAAAIFVSERKGRR